VRTVNLKEYIQGVLAKQGIQQAAAVRVSFDNGNTIIVASDDHPALDQPAETVKEAKVIQSATAGR
jgi:hypothetical protein